MIDLAKAGRERFLQAFGRVDRPSADQLLALSETVARCAPGFAPPIAEQVLAGYETLSETERRAFLSGLASRFTPDLDRLDRAVAAFRRRSDPAALAELHLASEPRRQQLFRNLNLARDGTARLVRMRSELGRWRRDVANFETLDADLSHLLSAWFNTGFLRLVRIDWSSPASLLRKIIAYEAVHEIGDWDELRRRLEPEDRRCYAFFHSGMPDEPLIFVEVALTTQIPQSIDALLSPSREPSPPDQAHTAVFYSISNCQDGLRGIPFGAPLIKQVVELLRSELPGLRTFVTLSPLPGLRAWVEAQAEDPGIGPVARAALGGDPSAEHVRLLAARYLVSAKTGSGQVLDPVGRFHLGNGACVYDIHPGADQSAKAAEQSFGAMVNYLYDLRSLERNRASLDRGGPVAATGRIRALGRRLSRPIGKGAAAAPPRR
ncbi:MAG: malonyl-CoA decarboxylase family protein [Phenylobacterium sp.]|nr:malonyl-CoA decarboxylase family protein [Phenylobacterium sp.]